MMTLREFVEKVNFHEHYRVYQPNRDCLIYESYFKVHSPYFFDNAHEEAHEWFNSAYYDNNDFCDDVRHAKELDEETKTFLEKFGDYIVFSLECGCFRPVKMYKGEDGDLKFEYFTDPLRPNLQYNEYIDCFNVFIIPANTL